MNMLDFIYYSDENEKMHIKRTLHLPSKSFILLGPRGCGKSTLIHHQLKFDLQIDLLKSKNFLPLSANPSLLEGWTRNLKPGAWVLIDEVQKIPALMDEVHSLYESKRLNFALSGSSARKLKRSGVNLLAGRALLSYLFPLTYMEYQKTWTLEEAIDWGSLPQVITESAYKEDYLLTYLELYLRQELAEEGIIRKLEPFRRFLQVCGAHNAQILNVDNIARESHIARSTIDKYFEILEDTLLGFRLQPFQPKWNRKEFTHPKFYLFDSGVARSCAELLTEEVDNYWRGFSFESLIINEVRAYNYYLKKNKNIFYYKYSSGYEIDLIIENKKKSISTKQELTAIEIKLAKQWDKRWEDPLIDLQIKSHGKIKSLVGVYMGKNIIEKNHIKIYPASEFLKQLALGEII